MVTILYFENGDSVYSLCEAEEREEFVYLMLDHSIAAIFKREGIREIERKESTESLRLDYPLNYFIWQQYDRLGRLQYLWPTWPLDKPIGEDNGMGI